MAALLRVRRCACVSSNMTGKEEVAKVWEGCPAASIQLVADKGFSEAFALNGAPNAVYIQTFQTVSHSVFSEVRPLTTPSGARWPCSSSTPRRRCAPDTAPRDRSPLVGSPSALPAAGVWPRVRSEERLSQRSSSLSIDTRGCGCSEKAVSG